MAFPALAPAVLSSHRPQLSDALFRQFAVLIYRLSGIRFETAKSYFLASRINTRVHALGLGGFQAYLAYLGTPQDKAEHALLINEITINETFFFRHQPQLQAFQNDILIPLVAARRAQNQPTFRILSAGASSGDELYTMALMLKNLGLAAGATRFELIGVDISQSAVQKANAAVYRNYNVRNVPPALLRQYFTASGGTQASPGARAWALKPEIRKMCRFQQGNLMDAACTAALGTFDIIFCRNLLIYFDEASKQQVTANLAAMLANDGFVLFGHSENIANQRHILHADPAHAAAIAYVKTTPGTSLASA